MFTSSPQLSHLTIIPPAPALHVSPDGSFVRVLPRSRSLETSVARRRFVDVPGREDGPTRRSGRPLNRSTRRTGYPGAPSATTSHTARAWLHRLVPPSQGRAPAGESLPHRSR